MAKKAKKKKVGKIDPERKQAYDSLPPNVRQRLTEEEKELFLNAEEWPDSLFDKLKEFIT
jgi:hypothetical protein